MIKNLFTGSGITLTDNEIKDIIKVIKSLENREISRKITSQEGGFLTFLNPLMAAGLPLISDFVTIRIISKNVNSRCSNSKENTWIKKYSVNNFK